MTGAIFAAITAPGFPHSQRPAGPSRPARLEQANAAKLAVALVKRRDNVRSGAAIRVDSYA